MTTALTATDEAVVSFLMQHTPAEVDKSLASRALSRGVKLTADFRLSGPEGTCNVSIRGFSVACRPDVDPMTAVQAEIEAIDRAMTPAPQQAIEAWLADLDVITAKRADDATGIAMRLLAYTRRLADQPADAVRHALTVKTWKFWPTWDELKAEIDSTTERRRLMRAALERFLSKPAPSREDRAMSRVTPEEADRIRAEVEAKFAEAQQ